MLQVRTYMFRSGDTLRAGRIGPRVTAVKHELPLGNKVGIVLTIIIVFIVDPISVFSQ
jgi:hypothetical protein